MFLVCQRMRILVTGAGGFIGHHLVKRLKNDGHWVRGVDIKNPEYENTPADEFYLSDLRNYIECSIACADIDEVYNLAADMGGIGYITAHLADIARNNTLINVNMLEAARSHGIKKFLFSSSACVYAQNKQHDADVVPLKEEDAYPADPEPGYGWEKLFAEQMCEYYRKDHGLDVRIVRFHNVYGPLGTYDGGKEKAPAAVCRKTVLCNVGEIEIWGDGKQTRTFMYIDDCVEGLIRLMASDCTEPLNLGTDELVTIDELFDKAAKIAGKSFLKNHNLSKPQGVRGRNSDNSKLREVLGWEPSIKLDDGLAKTYRWIEHQIHYKAAAENWKKDGAEHTLRVTFPLTQNSVVYDVGGYTGEWASELIDKYNPFVHIFEPIRYMYDDLLTKFHDNKKVFVYQWALLDRNGPAKITKEDCRSSLYTPTRDAREDIYTRDIVELDVPDLISINAEGAEYVLLKRMLDTGWAQRCPNIQVQFHGFYTGSFELREQIREELSKTHVEVYNYPFVWEYWTKK